MRNPRLRSGDTEHQFQHRVKKHEYACRHGNRRDQRHDGAIREDQGVGQQNSEHAGRGADNRAAAGTEQPADQQLRHSTGHDAGKVGHGHAAHAPHPLQLAAEHPQRKHVECQMGQATVQKTVGDELPGGQERKARQAGPGARPEGEPLKQDPAHLHFEKIDNDVGNDEGLCEWRQHEVPSFLRVGSTWTAGNRLHVTLPDRRNIQLAFK